MQLTHSDSIFKSALLIWRPKGHYTYIEEKEEEFYKLRHDKNGPVVVREAVLVQH